MTERRKEGGRKERREGGRKGGKKRGRKEGWKGGAKHFLHIKHCSRYLSCVTLLNPYSNSKT
jgi:hypothetical protein